jgi:hypothetical protein
MPTARCEVCGGDLVEIELTVDGRDLVMSSCSTCDTRTWRSDGDAIELDGVIADLSSAPRRYRRSLSN